jgi:hypothetical protein
MMPEQFPYPAKGWSTGNMRLAGSYTPGTTLGMFPPKKKKQLEKEQGKEDVEEQKFQMSPKQLRGQGVSKIDTRTIIDESQGIRTLEGEKKRRETQVSEAASPAEVAFGDNDKGTILGKQLQLAGDIKPLRIPANENRQLQIPDDPYTMGQINQQWNEMVKKGKQPALSIVPKERG